MLSEITPAAPGGALGFVAEQTHLVTKQPSAALSVEGAGLDEVRAALQAALDAAMQGLVEALAAK